MNINDDGYTRLRLLAHFGMIYITHISDFYQKHIFNNNWKGKWDYTGS